MSRFAVDPQFASSTCEERVRFCETDLMGIVHHAAYLPYFEVGRVDWLRKRGVTYRTWASSGLHLPLVDMTCKFHKPALFDDALQIRTTLDEIRVASVRFAYIISRDGERLVEGTTRLACVNAEHRPIRLPAYVLDVLHAPELS